MIAWASDAAGEGDLFVASRDDLLLYFRTVEEAEGYLEWADVLNGEYPAAYGPAGQPFRILAEGEVVSIMPTGEANRPAELKALILDYYEVAKEPADPEQDLAGLVARFRIDWAFWAEHDPYGERFGTAIPWWGCLLAIMGLAAAGYLILR